VISHASFQEQVIDTLQANAALVALLPSVDEIREYYYQATEFAYPNIRVDTRPQVPDGTGNCRLKHSILNFAIVYNSENDSSLECEQLGFAVVEALFGVQLNDAAPAQGPAWQSLRTDLLSLGNPIRTGERIWSGTAVFRCRVTET
jgi:hypothetical protein